MDFLIIVEVGARNRAYGAVELCIIVSFQLTHHFQEIFDVKNFRMMALIAPHWILDLTTGKAFTVQTDLHSSLSVHELVVVITSHEIFA